MLDNVATGNVTARLCQCDWLHVMLHIFVFVYVINILATRKIPLFMLYMN